MPKRRRAAPTAARSSTLAPAAPRRRVWWLAAIAGLAVVGLAAAAFWSLDPDKWQGLELANKGRFPEAEPLLQKALERHANDIDVLRAMALGKLATRPAEAEPYLTRWCE